MRTNKKRTRTKSTDGPPRNPSWRTHAAKSSALVARCCQEIGTSDLLSGAYELEDKKAPYSPFRRPEQGTPTMLRRVYTCRQIRSGGGPKAEARLAPFPQMGFLRIAVTPGSREAAQECSPGRQPWVERTAMTKLRRSGRTIAIQMPQEPGMAVVLWPQSSLVRRHAGTLCP